MALKTHQSAMDFDAGYVNDLHLEKGVFLLINDNEIEASWLEIIALQVNFWITESTYSYDMQSQHETSHILRVCNTVILHLQCTPSSRILVQVLRVYACPRIEPKADAHVTPSNCST
jgi:hypothetical protein